ncbi:MAG TPA: DNA helicase II, partial [Gammaproteobacteria bacterium]|nr:DNA helicase II [Gammaproteobacteria bacterium]
MDITHILDALNERQREAVTAPLGHALVLAGAGSGKTRVLVHRIAWLIEAERVSPHGILAVTFTNKAAAEMRARIEALLRISAQSLWVGTFHGIAHRLLRFHWREAGLPQNFQILDSDDQLRLVKRVMRSLDLDEAKWPARQAAWFINAAKDDGRRARDVPGGDLFQETHRRVYANYESLCQTGGLVDFAELLLRSHELWLEQPALLSHYQARFGQILVDEFQDTNTIQYAWLRVLAGRSAQVMAVGDDDQSIYGWRGARIEHIQRFSDDFPGATVVRLEQNYRSTGTILKAANALIANNAERLGKALWTDGAEGEPIRLYAGFNDADEARFIAEQIGQWVAEGGSPEDVAILYRSNAQSRVLEEALLRAQIPYRIYGGLRFFERAEIKNALAYMRLALDRHADPAFERVINTPTRG